MLLLTALAGVPGPDVVLIPGVIIGGLGMA